MYDRHFTTLEEDAKRPMRLQSSKQAQEAREALKRPRITVRHVEVKCGDATFKVYPTVGTVFIGMGDTRIALTAEQTRALQSLLNTELDYDDETLLLEADTPDIDLTTKDKETP